MKTHVRSAGPWLACLASALGASLAWAGAGVWTTTGPEGGDANLVVADAGSAGTLIAATRGGVFRSSDGGASWNRHEDGLAFVFPYLLEASSSGSAAFVAGDTRRLFRSDAGAAWFPTGLVLPGGAYLTDLSLRAGSGQFLSVGTSSGLYHSADGGVSFAPIAAAGLPPGAVAARVDEAGPSRLYIALADLPAGVTSHVWRSDDGGASFTATTDLPGSIGFLGYLDGDLEAAPSDPDRIYFASSAAMFVSSNAGASWTECGDSYLFRGARLVVEPGNPDHVWATGRRGVYRSTNGCASWSALDTGMIADGSRIAATSSLALAPGFPGDDRLWVGTDFGGVFRSEDAGASFVPANAGLISSNIRAIAMHPADTDQILLGYGDAFTPSPALYRSADDGVSWSRSNTGMRATQLRGITIDPTTASLPGGAHVYAVGSSRPQDEVPSLANTDGGIYKSTDGGATWSTIDAGLPATFSGGTRFIGTVRSLVLDPRSCLVPGPGGLCGSGPLQTAYVTASGRANFAAGTYAAARVYKSLDAGGNWSASENGLPGPVGTGACAISQIAVPLVIDSADPDTLYLGLSLNAPTDPACAAPTIDNGIFKSIDGGANWTHSSTGLPRLAGPGSSHWNVLALAIDPSDPDVLYAGAYEPVGGSFNGRVLKSIDAGATWTDISVGIAGADVRALLVDPANPSIVYAGTGGSPVNPSGVYRSTDGGLTWNSFSIGLPADAATALALDPFDPDRLLAGTPGGLWEWTAVPDEDSDGASTATEDAAPNGGDADASGIPDAQEADVASFASAPGIVPRGTPVPMITLAVEPLAGNCARINNAHALAGTSLPADIAQGVAPAQFDRGVLRFELPERARVRVTFHGADFSDVDWTWRNHGPLVPGDAATMTWYGFEGARKLDASSWELIIDAQARGNYRAAASDILFVGAPGFVDLQVFGDGFE
jgi:photosystem II stability/assembly factor-like uncharacterized protein